MSLPEKTNNFFQKNKDRVVFRLNKYKAKLLDYFIDVCVLLLIPKIAYYLRSMFKKSEKDLIIGIFRQGGVGDRIVLGAFAAAVERRFPNSHITAIVNNSKDPLIGHPSIDRIKLHNRWLHLEKVEKFNQKKYDIFYSLRYVPKVFVNSTRLIDYKSQVEKIFNKYSQEFHESLKGTTPRSLNTLGVNGVDLLTQFSAIEGGQKDLFIRISESDRKILTSIPFSQYITINNGQFRGRETRCWPTDHWSQLVEKIKGIGHRVILLGIESDEYVDGCYDLRGKTSLYEAAAIIEKAILHVDTEGGMVFIAKAVRKKSIVLFGPDYPEFFGLEGNINLRKNNICKPCCDQDFWRWKCHLGYERCKAMEAIKPEEVFSLIVNELKIDWLKVELVNQNKKLD